MKKEYRIKKSSEIEEIIKLKKSMGNKYLVLYKRENHENTHFRFAISVPKKYGNAVERNKMKRRVREIISKQEGLVSNDIFIVVKKNAGHLSFEEIQDNLVSLLKRQNILR